MIFTKKNAGKWVASKGGKVIATDATLAGVLRQVESRRDRDTIRYDLVPLFPDIAMDLATLRQ